MKVTLSSQIESPRQLKVQAKWKGSSRTDQSAPRRPNPFFKSTASPWISIQAGLAADPSLPEGQAEIQNALGELARLDPQRLAAMDIASLGSRLGELSLQIENKLSGGEQKALAQALLAAMAQVLQKHPGAKQLVIAMGERGFRALEAMSRNWGSEPSGPSLDALGLSGLTEAVRTQSLSHRLSFELSILFPVPSKQAGGRAKPPPQSLVDQAMTGVLLADQRASLMTANLMGGHMNEGDILAVKHEMHEIQVQKELYQGIIRDTQESQRRLVRNG